MLKRTVLLNAALCASLVSAAYCQPTAANETSAPLDELTPLYKTAVQCQFAAIKRLDDGISDAAVIANVVVAECINEIEAADLAHAQSFAKTSAEIDAFLYSQETKDRRYQTTTRAVLMWRAQKRNSQTK